MTGWCDSFVARDARNFKINHLVDHRSSLFIVNRMVDNNENTLDLIFAALSDRTRRAILNGLLDGDRTVNEIAAPIDMSLAAVSKHLQILSKAGLITQHKEGREKRCQLQPDTLREAVLWIESYGDFVQENFDALESLLENNLSFSEFDGLALDDLGLDEESA